MLSQLFTTTSRFSLTTTVRFLQFSAKNTARFGGNSGEGLANQFKFILRSGGATIKKRLLGPTSGKPFVYGMIAVAGASAVGIGSLMYYGLSSKESSILEQSALWSNGVRQKVLHTYSYLLGSLTITAGTAFAASRYRPLLRFALRMDPLAFFGSLAAVIGTMYLCKAIDYDCTVAKHATWLLLCGVLGTGLAPICLMGGPLVIRAAWCTVGIVAGLSTIAICAPSEKFLKWSGPLAMAFGVVFTSCIGWFFLPTSSALGANLASIVVFGGLIVFAMYLIYHTQRIVADAVEHEKLKAKADDGKVPSFDPINAQMGMLFDIVNMFISILQILDIVTGGNKRGGKRGAARGVQKTKTTRIESK